VALVMIALNDRTIKILLRQDKSGREIENEDYCIKTNRTRQELCHVRSSTKVILPAGKTTLRRLLQLFLFEKKLSIGNGVHRTIARTETTGKCPFYLSIARNSFLNYQRSALTHEV
jgi:hypothetical protein